jgi:hypothetical protein
MFDPKSDGSRQAQAPAVPQRTGPTPPPLSVSFLTQLASVFLMVVSLSGCFSSTIDPLSLNGFPSTTDATDNDDDSGNNDSSDSTSGTAQDQCLLFDKTSPVRNTCIGCYDQLVATYCPGKTSISDCVDADFILDFPARLNQCIDATTLAGFTCTKSCSGTQVLDDVTCSCISASTASTGTTALEQIDRGQFDLGPPVVSVAFPREQVERIVFDDGEDPDNDPADNIINSCALGGAIDSGIPFLNLSIRNRGGTRVQDNVMTATKGSVQPTDISLSVGPPEILSQSGILGINGGASVNLSSFGTNAFEDATNGKFAGAAGGIRRISGQPVPDPTPTPNATPSDSVRTDLSEIGLPGYATRDAEGNIYYTDTQAGTVHVICLVADSQWCSTTGKTLKIAGGGSTDYRTQNGTDLDETEFKSPMGIAVDTLENIYIADHENGTIAIICQGSLGPCARAPTSRKVYALAGSGISNGPWNGNSQLTGNMGSPIAIDVDIDVFAHTVNLYVAKSDTSLDFSAGDLLAACEFTDGIGPCTADPLNGIFQTLSSELATDVKLNAYGNLFWVEPLNGLVRAKCAENVSGDPCFGKATSSTVTLNSTTASSDTGDGGLTANAGFVLPFRLVIAKRFADDYTDVDEVSASAAYRFADKNLIVISALSQASDFHDRHTGGNTVRIICGTYVDEKDNTGVDYTDTNADGEIDTLDGKGLGPDDFAGSKGFCEDLEDGKVYTLAGQSGRTGTGASSSSSPQGVAFGNLTGGTYDRFKNLILTSAHDTTLFGNDDDLLDRDGDHITDDIDTDADGDGWDRKKNSALFDLSSKNSDGGAQADDVDTDDDGDGIADVDDADQDGDGVKDWDLGSGNLNLEGVFSDGGGLPDSTDPDDDNDGIDDINDMDQDGNGLLDFDPDETGVGGGKGDGIMDSTQGGFTSDDPNFPPLYDDSIYSLQLVRKSSNFKVRYNFTDSNNFTSRYCLEMRVKTTCGYATQASTDTAQKAFCACSVTGPGGSNSSSADFWRGVARDEDCQ